MKASKLWPSKQCGYQWRVDCCLFGLLNVFSAPKEVRLDQISWVERFSVKKCRFGHFKILSSYMYMHVQGNFWKNLHVLSTCKIVNLQTKILQARKNIVNERRYYSVFSIYQWPRIVLNNVCPALAAASKSTHFRFFSRFANITTNQLLFKIKWNRSTTAVLFWLRTASTKNII